jgi:hypothetical protein
VFIITIAGGIYLSVFDRVLKYLPPMPQPPKDIPSVITVENTDEMILSVMFSREIIFFCRASPFKDRRWLVFLFPIESATE